MKQKVRVTSSPKGGLVRCAPGRVEPLDVQDPLWNKLLPIKGHLSKVKGNA